MFKRVGARSRKVLFGDTRQRPDEIIGQRRTELHLGARHRMLKPNPRRMQEMSLGRQSHKAPASTAPIRVISNDGMTDRREVDANLVGATRVQVRAEQIDGLESREADKIRPGRPPSGDDGDPRPVPRIARERFFDGDPIAVDVTPGQHRVSSHDAARPQRLSQHAMRAVGLRHDEQA
jgi:hypothetical protein